MSVWQLRWNEFNKRRYIDFCDLITYIARIHGKAVIPSDKRLSDTAASVITLKESARKLALSVSIAIPLKMTTQISAELGRQKES